MQEVLETVPIDDNCFCYHTLKNCTSSLHYYASVYYMKFFSILHVHKIWLERIRRGMLNSIQVKPKSPLKLNRGPKLNVNFNIIIEGIWNSSYLYFECYLCIWYFSIPLLLMVLAFKTFYITLQLHNCSFCETSK